MKKQLRVGFDLDGVILYNPARIVRPIIVKLKKIFFKNDVEKFHLPQNWLQKTAWLFLHKSSLFPSSGLHDIKKLIETGKIEAYIISARYELLKDDFDSWLNNINAKKYFKGCYHNNDNEQPYLYKEKMIKKLNLDIYVEDNWDIVKYLKSKVKSQKSPLRPSGFEGRAKVFWIYNILDRHINYEYKFSGLKKVAAELLKLSSQVKI